MLYYILLDLTLIVNRFEELQRSRAVCKDDVKSVRDWPAASSSVVAALPLPLTAAAAARDLPLAELQRLYGTSFLPPVSGFGAMPAVLPQAFCQSPDLAAELIQRERERLEHLGKRTYVESAHNAVRISIDNIVSVTASVQFNILLNVSSRCLAGKSVRD